MFTCQQMHAACPSSKPPALPMRVVQISADSDGMHCKLHLSSENECHEYLALSHCWGDPNKIPKTERASVKRHQEEIPVHFLSRTFLDAMRVTAELGYRFIWIDALCILQDDHDDWEREAAKMAAIYGNASLTIAAASSSDGSGGCLYDRRGGGVISLTQSEALGGGLTTHEALSHSLFSSLVTSTQQSSSNSPNPLVLRKWCYQERILSPRILYYSFDEMLWECRETIECECGNPGEIHTIGAKAGSSKVTFDSLLYSPHVPYGAASDRVDERALRAWRILVEAYSKARLSYETDVLPALAGVAERFASASLGKYVAGLWTDPFLNLLSWRSKPSGTSAHTRPTAYCAPTWSWASIQGQITFHEDFASKDFDAKVISVSRTLETEYAYGRITEAVLVLNARALFRKVTKCKPGFDWLVGETALYQRVTFAGLKDTLVLNLDTEQDGVDLKGKTICMLCLYKRKAVSTSDVDASFLLLVEAEDRSTYRRDGILTDDGMGGHGGFCALIGGAPRRDFTIC